MRKKNGLLGCFCDLELRENGCYRAPLKGSKADIRPHDPQKGS